MTETEDALAFLKSLPRDEQRAFRALFRGARFPWTSFNGGPPSMGKAECEWVEDWRAFYGVKLKDAGLFHFEESEPAPALGMKEGSTFVTIECGPTELGRAVYWAWMDEERGRNEAAE